MAGEENGNGETSVTTPLGGFTYKGKRMAELISVCLLCLTFLLTYILWEHKNNTKDNSTALSLAIKELSLSQRAMVEAQREMTCVISMPQEKRENAYGSPYSLCKQLARER